MSNSIQFNTFNTLLQKVKEKKPLVHHLTNYVTVNDCANIVLALGASPIMADYIGEINDILPRADALVVNLGTINEQKAETILKACEIANANNIPVVLDPVGIGVSSFRLGILRKIIGEYKLAVIKGNASEISIIAGLSGESKGVDVGLGDMITPLSLRELSMKLDTVIALTGPTDYITFGEKTITITNGSKYLAQLTGTGCMIGSMIGTFATVTSKYIEAAALGVLIMGVAGDICHDIAQEDGMGSFKVKIFDVVSKIDENVLRKVAKIENE
ncbi:hydroxyethylthiazole kinase [Alkalicella caledoniensis]|uniref:Hydroxyethylthiazole kinase n=1 Tax=Alkalicella caledoniensis TaxID=2731377 RepID=A0A7G9W5B4_ALKCA|nr:hydroxyethylthiazole kinase [Alkalicella caledoniensis]QNO13876.1 hydroxyethylthiazole kinase [Alkalicella caledoniensis]